MPIATAKKLDDTGHHCQAVPVRSPASPKQNTWLYWKSIKCGCLPSVGGVTAEFLARAQWRRHGARAGSRVARAARRRRQPEFQAQHQVKLWHYLQLNAGPGCAWTAVPPLWSAGAPGRIPWPPCWSSSTSWTQRQTELRHPKGFCIFALLRWSIIAFCDDNDANAIRCSCRVAMRESCDGLGWIAEFMIHCQASNWQEWIGCHGTGAVTTRHPGLIPTRIFGVGLKNLVTKKSYERRFVLIFIIRYRIQSWQRRFLYQRLQEKNK